eukprot:3002384-Prymnesium_polylepis.1
MIRGGGWQVASGPRGHTRARGGPYPSTSMRHTQNAEAQKPGQKAKDCLLAQRALPRSPPAAAQRAVRVPAPPRRLPTERRQQ